MAYYVRVRGFEVRCDTAIEALALAERAAGSSRRPDGSAKRVVSTVAAKNAPAGSRQRDMVVRSLRFISAVKDAGSVGIGGDKLVKKVGCEGSAGLGTIVQNTRRLLDDAGIKIDGVVVKNRKGDQKLWTAGASVEDGIAALKALQDGA